MVHRSSDSRILDHLISHEKDYAKQILSLLTSSQSSINSLAAFGACSPPPVSAVILAVANSLAAADEALRQYAASVDQWRIYLQELKGLEDEVNNIMRDREILVTRLIKASKSSEKPSNRNSILGRSVAYHDASNISLSSDEIPISTSYAPSPAFSQPNSFPSIVNKRLQSAQSELQACEACLASKERELEAKRTEAVREGLSMRSHVLTDCGRRWTEAGLDINHILDEHRLLSNATVLATKPLPELEAPSSDLSSIAPSQSASQINVVTSPAEPSTPVSGSPQKSSLTSPPTSERDSAVLDSGFPKHNLPRKITGEDLGFRPGTLTSHQEVKEAESSDDDREALADVRVVENVRFMSAAASASKLPLPSSQPESSPAKRSRTMSFDQSPSGSKFFGTIRGLFSRHPKASTEDDDSIIKKEKRKGKSWEMRTQKNLDRSPTIAVSESADNIGKRLRRGRGPAARAGVSDAVLQMRRRSRSLDSHMKQLDIAASGQSEHQQSSEAAVQHTESVAPKRSHRSSSVDLTLHSSPHPHNRVLSGLAFDTTSTSSLSRNSSLTSAASAPANLSARKRTRTIATVPAHSASHSALVTHRAHKAIPATTKAERRVSSPANGKYEAGTSLMRIVEEVSRANRQGWKSADAGPSPANGAIGNASSKLDVPKAPRSVFEPDDPEGLPIVVTSSDETVRASQQARGPLRSALRNSSRSPSPMLNRELDGLPNTTPGSLLPQAAMTYPKDDKGSDDGASISSYETGHEAFEEDTAVDVDNSQVSGSASNTSTETPIPPPLPDKPRRRKSVRVSLQPTFSTTPPAIDYDDAEWEHKPWARTSVHDVWEDSSDEDVEYQNARKLLTRASKKS